MEEKTEFEKSIENETGETIEAIREMPIDERRYKTEQKHGSPLKFTSHYPFIGRGNILFDSLLSHQEIEKELDKALRK